MDWGSALSEPRAGRSRPSGTLARYWPWLLAFAALVVGLYLVRLGGRANWAQWVAPTAVGSAWRSRGLFLASVKLAACALGLALLLGFPVGVHLGRRGSAAVAALTLVPLTLPPHVAAYVWRFTLEDLAELVSSGAAWWRSPRWSFLGSAWTLAAMYWPVVALPVALAMRVRGSRVEEELATVARPRAVFWRAVVPGLLPGLVAGGGVFFLLALSNYGVPLMWNVPSQNVAVFARLAAFFSPGEAMALALPLQVLVLVLSVLGVVWLSRRSYGFDLSRVHVGRGAGLAGGGRWFWGATCGVLLATVGLPLAALLAGPGTTTMLKANFVAGRDPYLWGLVLATLGATGATVLGLVLAVAFRGANRVAVGVVEVVGLSALFVPATILCLLCAGMLAGGRWLEAFYYSLGIFPLVYGLRFFYISWKTVRLVQRFEGREHREAEQLIGLGPLARAQLAIQGLLRPALAVAWLVVFALALGELEMATFLAQPGRQPLSTFLDNLMHYGRSPSVAQWSLVVVATEVAVAWTVLALGLSQWRKYRVRT